MTRSPPPPGSAEGAGSPPKPGEPGSAENPIKVKMADVAPGGRMLKMTLLGVTLWEEGEVLTPEERERRFDQAMARAPEDLRPDPALNVRQDYAGSKNGEPGKSGNSR